MDGWRASGRGIACDLRRDVGGQGHPFMCGAAFGSRRFRFRRDLTNLCPISTLGTNWEIEMPQNITTSVKSMVAEAEKELDNMAVERAIGLHGNEDVLFIDIRDIRELQRDGKVPGAFHCPRGMLEFWIDPQSPYHKDLFAQDKTYVFFCAGGLRSALAAQTAQRMGLKPVAHIKGGFGAWKTAGGPVEMPEPKQKG